MPTSYDPRVRKIITQQARRAGLDPAAVLAVAAGEGGIRKGAVGDGGTSFGPFQLHWNGAMPKKYWNNAQASSAFANSPAGVAYALRQMSKAGASGLAGADAVNAIVRKFERPADPDTSVSNALGRLGQFKSSGSSPTGTRGSPMSPMSQPVQMGGMGVDPTQFKQAFASFLMNAATQQGAPDFGGLMQLAQARKQMIAAQEGFGPTVQEPAGAREPGRPTTYNGKVMQPGTEWKGTHTTDNLGWGNNTAQDVMGKPGTPVGAPEDGKIIRHGGAQGGEALYFQGKSGRVYWMGHISGMAPVGTKVRAGQPIAQIADQNVSAPHLHIDKK